VQVVPDHDQRPLLRGQLEEATDGERDLLFRRGRLAAEQCLQWAGDRLVELT
jgi:hypothetical protein